MFVAPEGFAVVVGVGARANPIHLIGVRLDLNLAILTSMESQQCSDFAGSP